MLRVYEVKYSDSSEEAAYVVAMYPAQAKYVATTESRCRFYRENWTALRVRLYPFEDLTELIDQDGVQGLWEPRWLFDNETYNDVLEAERRWFDSQCL